MDEDVIRRAPVAPLSPARAALIAGISLVAGIQMARATLLPEVPRATSTSDASAGSEAVGPGPGPAPSPAPARGGPGATAPPPQSPAPAPNANANANAEDEPQEAASPAGPVHRGLTFLPGRVAYLRCDGVPGARPSVCPRDSAFEEAVWGALADTTTCPGLGPGTADVRVEFRGQGRTLYARELTGTPAVPPKPLLGCMEGRLSAIPFQPVGTRVVVSFTFALEAKRP